MSEGEYEDHIALLCQQETERLQFLYSPSEWSKRFEPKRVIAEHVKRTTEATSRARAKLNSSSLGIKYGPSDKQTIDVYSNAATPQDAPIFVFLHGGYWQDLSIDCSGFMAIPLVEAGAKVVAVGYDLAPKVSVEEIVSQTKEAIVHVVRMAVNTNSRGVYLCGHSAGAHLVIKALDADLKQTLSTVVAKDSAAVIKGAFLISGVYDLRPLVFIGDNNALRMTVESAWHLSPMNRSALDQLTSHWHSLHIVVAVAEHDTSEFRNQSKHYNTLLSRNGIWTKYIDLPNVDHFDIAECLDEPDYALTKELQELMKLRGKEKNQH